MILKHGGNTVAASARFGIPVSDWLDLSTGINQLGYPIPDISCEAWSRLPQPSNEFDEAASHYYGSTNFLAIAGSQAAIQSLPQLRQPGRVGILEPTYAEHKLSWEKAGHQLIALANEQEIQTALPKLGVLLLCNPNNPTGKMFSADQLLTWKSQLRDGAWLIVDEAFIDTEPENSITTHGGTPNLIILRSLGKFFGLAGARVGFVFAWQDLLDKLQHQLGPWTISGPAQAVAAAALSDYEWQHQARHDLRSRTLRLAHLLQQAGVQPTGSTDFFHWIKFDGSEQIFNEFGKQGILIRLFANPLSIRIAPPGREQHWVRLERALTERLWQAPDRSIVE